MKRFSYGSFTLDELKEIERELEWGQDPMGNVDVEAELVLVRNEIAHRESMEESW